jgi:hypothetical protein
VKRKHGQSSRSLPGGRTRLYLAWRNMRSRCRNPKDKHFADYGGRGISICSRWDEFACFAEDMGPHPGVGFSLDRRRNADDYSPSNCRWATAAEQSRNKRNNVMLTLAGRTQCIADWARETGLSQSRIQQRVASGWSHERALTLPPITKQRT